MLQRATLPRAFRVEQGQLPMPRVRADEREVRLLGDHVHAEVALTVGDDRLAIRHPKCDVVESSRLHPRDVSDGALAADGRNRDTRAPPEAEPERHLGSSEWNADRSGTATRLSAWWSTSWQRSSASRSTSSQPSSAWVPPSAWRSTSSQTSSASRSTSWQPSSASRSTSSAAWRPSSQLSSASRSTS